MFLIKNTKKYLKGYIDLKYPNWDITIALRYLPIIDDLKKNYKPEDKILEVGSEITGITNYFPVEVTGLDVAFDYSKKNEYLKPVKGSATQIPFEDKSFDFVLSVDMLEHIPDDLREKVIQEMIRVCRKKLYLSFPCGKKSEEVDQRLHQYFLKKRGQDYQYLKEHVSLGLPNYNHVKSILKSTKGFKLTIKNNTNIKLWEILLKLGLSGEKFKSSLYRRLLIALPLLKYFNFSPTYRKLFILERI